MKKIGFLMIIGMVLFADNISGDYLLTTVEKKGETTYDYMQISFLKGGKLEVMGMTLGGWKYDKAQNKVFLTSTFEGTENEENKILKHDDKELVLQSKDATTHYMKLDIKKIEEDNAKAPFLGSWEVITNDNESSKLTFSLPDNFTYELHKKRENSTESVRGTWIYEIENEELIVVSLGSPLRGKNKIGKIDAHSIVFENNNEKINVQKK